MALAFALVSFTRGTSNHLGSGSVSAQCALRGGGLENELADSHTQRSGPLETHPTSCHNPPGHPTMPISTIANMHHSHNYYSPATCCQPLPSSLSHHPMPPPPPPPATCHHPTPLSLSGTTTSASLEGNSRRESYCLQ